jgi:hypothetical protein
MLTGVDEATATAVVERLRARNVFASVNRRAGVYNVGVRVVLPGGREAIWDNDGAAGLEAMVLRDGVLVGFVPQVADSEDLDVATIADLIAGTDYDAPVATRPGPAGGAPAAGRGEPSSTPGGGPASPRRPRRVGFLDRFRRR